MRNTLRSAVSYLLALSLFAWIVPLTPRSSALAGSAPPGRQKVRRSVKGGQVRTGPEAAARIRKLREESADVRAALRAFERRGRAPKVEEAVVVVGEFAAAAPAGGEVAGHRGGRFRKASFTPQEQTAVGGNGFEFVLIPSLETAQEWQGTAISTMYDEYGNVVSQYVANIVTVPTSSSYSPQVVYELMYTNGVPYLRHQPGMYTGFSLGMTIQEHQATFGSLPPMDLLPEQFASAEQEQDYYSTFPEQRDYDGTTRDPERRPGPVLMEQQQVARLSGAQFMKAGYQARSDRSASRHDLQRFCGNPNGCGPDLGTVMRPYYPNIQRYFVRVAAGCGTMVFCQDPRCRLVACGSAAISQLPVLFGY